MRLLAPSSDVKQLGLSRAHCGIRCQDFQGLSWTLLWTCWVTLGHVNALCLDFPRCEIGTRILSASSLQRARAARRSMRARPTLQCACPLASFPPFLFSVIFFPALLPFKFSSLPNPSLPILLSASPVHHCPPLASCPLLSPVLLALSTCQLALAGKGHSMLET